MLTHQVMNLSDIVENEVKSSTPIIMCSVVGYDASVRVDDLSTELNKPITSIAIGKWITEACSHRFVCFQLYLVVLL